MTKKFLAVAGAATLLGAVSALAATVSTNAIGYADTKVYDVQIFGAPPVGICLLANPFNIGNNRLSDIMPSAPDGAEVFTWDGTNYSQFVFLDGAWLPPSGQSLPVLAPGTGFWYHPPSPLPANPTTITFMGDVPRGTFATPVNLGFRIVSPPAGWLGYRVSTLSSMNPPSNDGDLAYIFHCDTLTYDIGAFLGGTWIGNYTVAAGQSFWSYKEAASSTWTQSVNPHGVTDVLDAALVLTDYHRSGSSFSFMFPTVAGRTYQVQSRVSPVGLWSNNGPVIPGTGNLVMFTDSSATANSKIYRVTR